MVRPTIVLATLTLVGCIKPEENDESASSTGPNGEAMTTSSSSSGGDSSSTSEGASSSSTSEGSSSSGESSTGAPNEGSPGTFVASTPIAIPNAWFPVTADLDGDAAEDLVITSTNAPSMSAIPGATPTDPFFSAAKDSRAAVALDFDGDGDSDIVAAQSPGGFNDRFASYRTDGQKFVEVTVLDLPECTYHQAIAAADLDADEHDDIVVACDFVPGVIVLAGQGDGNFAAPVTVSLDAHPVGAALIDVIGSEWPDLVTYDQMNPRLLVYPGTGELGFDEAGMQAFPVPMPYGMATGDIDGDGRQDALVNHTLDGTCSLFLGGDDGLVPGDTIDCGPYAVDIRIADVNGDTRGDLVAVHFFNSLPGELQIRLNLGDSFAAPVSHETGFDTWHLALGDYNADARPDIAVVTQDLVTFFYQDE